MDMHGDQHLSRHWYQIGIEPGDAENVRYMRIGGTSYRTITATHGRRSVNANRNRHHDLVDEHTAFRSSTKVEPT